MLRLFWRWQARQRAARLDWLFVVFLVFAVVMGSWTTLRARQLRDGWAAFRTCMASAVAGCASSEVQRLRSLGAEPLRVQIAQARVELLLGRVAEARAEITKLGAAHRLDGELRGELLVALGDLALAEGQIREARAHYTAADTLLPAGTGPAWRARVEALEQRQTQQLDQNLAQAKANRAAFHTAQVDARSRSALARRRWQDRRREGQLVSAGELRSALSEALGAIRAGSVDKAQVLLVAARRAARGLSGAAGSKAQLAIQAAERALGAVRLRNEARAARGMDTAGLLAPEHSEGKSGARFQRALDERLQQVEAEAQRAFDETLPLARRLLNEALQLAESPSGSLPGGQAVPGGRP